MKKRSCRWWLIMILSALMIISGCSTEEKANSHKKELESKEEKIPPASTDPEKIMMQKPGVLRG